MKPPFPWRTFILATLALAIPITLYAAILGYQDDTISGLGHYTWLDGGPAVRRHNCAVYAGITFPCALVGAFLLLCLLRWTWYFLLARLTEVSRAMKTNP